MKLVVIGGGQAAAQCIEAARQRGFTGAMTLVSEEATPPYSRPPLSKQYLTGLHKPDWLHYRPHGFYEKHNVELQLGRRAAAIDRAGQTVVLDDGTVLGYDNLALTTGARARKLAAPGADLANLFYIRTLADVDGLRAQLKNARRVVIIGAGFIGLETAAMLVQTGLQITLLAAANRLIPRLAGAEISAYLLQQHQSHGVDVHLNTTVTALTARGVVTDTQLYPADLVLAGIGAHPNVELAQAAGLDCDNGILVDAFARTSDEHIVAAGDCTNHPNALLGRRLRLETVHNAVEQGRTAGATIAGIELAYTQTPWVWSDQYGMRLQSAGVAEGFTRTVLRGRMEDGFFSVFYYRGDALLAVTSINQPLVFGAVRRILNARIPLPAEHAADSNFDLAKLPASNVRLEFDIPWTSRKAIDWGFS